MRSMSYCKADMILAFDETIVGELEFVTDNCKDKELILDAVIMTPDALNFKCADTFTMMFVNESGYTMHKNYNFLLLKRIEYKEADNSLGRDHMLLIYSYGIDSKYETGLPEWFIKQKERQHKFSDTSKKMCLRDRKKIADVKSVVYILEDNDTVSGTISFTKVSENFCDSKYFDIGVTEEDSNVVIINAEITSDCTSIEPDTIYSFKARGMTER